MPEQQPAQPASARRADWIVLAPEKLPALSIWPATMALAVTLLAWGFISSLMITLVGIGLIGVSLAGWIGNIRHERKQH